MTEALAELIKLSERARYLLSALLENEMKRKNHKKNSQASLMKMNYYLLNEGMMCCIGQRSSSGGSISACG